MTKTTYNKVTEGMAISLAAQVVGIDDEDEIDYITEQIVTLLEGEDDAGMEEFLLSLSPMQTILAGAVVGSVVKSWLLEEDLPKEGLPGYV